MAHPLVVRATWRHVIEVTGPDRVAWLHNLCTNDVLLLATGRRGDSFRKGERVRLERTPSGPGGYAVHASRQGKMVAEFALLLLEDRAILVTGEPSLPDALGKLIIMEEVAVAARPDLAVFEVFDGAFPDLALWHHARVAGAIVQRTTLGHTALADRFDGTPVAEDEYERRRIEAGWPRWGVDMDATVLPMEAGLEPVAISYTKGCYLGQEVIQRVKTYSEAPRQLVQLELEGAVERGASVMAEGREVGHVTSVAGRLALGLLRKEFKPPGTRVTIAGAAATVRGLPWQNKP